VALSADLVRRQIDAVMNDIGADAVKTGMLANRDIANAVVGAVRDHQITQLIVDPVMAAESGASLLDPEALAVVRDELMPLSALITPNTMEAGALLDMEIRNATDQIEAARRLVRRGARAALVKGGHLEGVDAVDVLAEGKELHELRAPRIPNPNTHGTGCMLSAAITAGLARGQPLLEAVGTAKRFTNRAITAGLAIGKG